jgi:hypothetical protein
MLIYVAGPIRPLRGRTVKENLDVGKKIALELWKDGHAVICPHANTDIEGNETVGARVWLNGDLQIVARCDAVVVVPDWEGSKGTEGEIAFAEERHIPVYYYPDKPCLHPTEVGSPVQCQAFMDVIMAMYRVHLNKNADYSPANILGTGELGVVVRLWDKVARLMNLTGFRLTVESATFGEPRIPRNESVDDAYMDLSVYGIIGMLVRKRAWGK